MEAATNRAATKAMESDCESSIAQDDNLESSSSCRSKALHEEALGRRGRGKDTFSNGNINEYIYFSFLFSEMCPLSLFDSVNETGAQSPLLLMDASTEEKKN